MGGLFGGRKSNSQQQATVLNSIRVQSSVYGLAVPIAYGQTRAAANLIWYGDFVATAHQSGGGGGGKGGGGGGGGTTSYTYSAAVALSLCEGPIDGAGQVWKDKAATTLGALNMTLFTGLAQQAPWGYLTTKHPGQDLGYEGVAYVGSGNYDLGDSADLPNHNFEIQGRLRYSPGTGIVDANPSDIIVDLLTNADYGAGFPSGNIGDLTPYSTWCVASGLFLSPLLNEQRATHEILETIAKLTNSAFVWSPGKLRLVPHADQAVSGNGATFTPNLTPLYDLNDDDFLVDRGEDPVECIRSSTADAFNDWQVEFLNRASQYAPQIAEAEDQANIEQFGLRTADVVMAHEIARADTARTVAQFLLQRGLYIRNRYRFKVGWKFSLLEPMDLITINDSALGLTQALVRVMEIEEDEEGQLDITAEEVPVGTSTPALYPSPPVFGYSVNYSSDPGNANPPTLFEPPPELAETGLEVWAAVSGGANWGGCEVWASSDNATYRRVSTIQGGARMGTLTAALPMGGDPDTTNVLKVDLTQSRGQLVSGTQTDADTFITLCYADGELVSYQSATLTAANKYDLTYLRRGAYRTSIAAHSSGAKFARLDAGIAKIPYDKAQIGTTLYLKFVSFNLFGGGGQEIANLGPTTYQISGPKPLPAPTGFSAAQNGGAMVFRWDAVKAADLAGYDLRYGIPGAAWTSMALLSQRSAGTEMTTAAVPPGTWAFAIKSRDIIDQLSLDTSMVTLAVSNAQTVIASRPQAPVWQSASISGFAVHWSGVLVPLCQGAASADGWNTFDKFLPNPVTDAYDEAPEIDLGLDGSPRLYAMIGAALGPGESAGVATAMLEVDYRTAAGAYGGFRPWTVGTATCRFIKARIHLQPANGSAFVSSFTPTADAPLRDSEHGENVSVASAGTAITFAIPFYNLPNVQVTPLASSAFTPVADSLTTTGFTLRLFNSSGTAVAGTANWQAKGV